MGGGGGVVKVYIYIETDAPNDNISNDGEVLKKYCGGRCCFVACGFVMIKKKKAKCIVVLCRGFCKASFFFFDAVSVGKKSVFFVLYSFGWLHGEGERVLFTVTVALMHRAENEGSCEEEKRELRDRKSVV